MYKMIIADDEPAVRQYLRYIVKQYNLPFFICGEAEDGEQAVNLATIYEAEFFILDIDMPVMSGLEAAKIIREKNRDAAIYILTAYSQFDYAHQAVQTQAAGYLLKPAKPAELVDTLKQGIAVMLRKRIAAQRFRRMEQQIAKDRPAVIKQRLFQLLKGDGDNHDALNLLRQTANRESFCPAAIISASYWSTATALPGAGLDERLLQECSAQFGDNAIIMSFSEELVIIIDRWDFDVRRALQSQLEKWEKAFNIKLCAGISLVARPAEIGRNYKHARKKREVGLFWQQQGLLIVDPAIDGSNEIDCDDIQKKVQHYLMERQPGQAKTVLYQFLDDIREQVCQPEFVYVAIIKIANQFIGKFSEYIISPGEAGLLRQKFIGKLNQTASFTDLKKCLNDLIDKLISYAVAPEQNQAEQAVKWAIEYIRNNYHKDLALEQFAGKLFMSTGYFCRIFKKHAGDGFATYLTGIRLKKCQRAVNERQVLCCRSCPHGWFPRC